MEIKFKKKSQMYQIMFVLIFFLFMAVVYFLVSYIIFGVGNDYIAVPLNQMVGDTHFSNNIINAVDKVGNSYHNTNLVFFDYGFLISYLTITIMGFLLAYKSKKLGYFGWLTGLFYGMQFLLMILGISLAYTNWVYDMIIAMFPNMVINLPFFNYFLDNMGYIFLSQSSMYFLVDMIDFDLSTFIGRKKKEQQIIEDEIV